MVKDGQSEVFVLTLRTDHGCTCESHSDRAGCVYLPHTPLSCALGSGRKLSSSESASFPGSHSEPESAFLGPVINFQSLRTGGTLEPDSLVSNPAVGRL